MKGITLWASCLAFAAAGCSSTEEQLPPNVLGDQAFENGEWEASVQYYTLWLNDHPDDFMSLYRRGVALDHMGEGGAAIVSLTAALDLRPESRDVLLSRAHVYYKVGNRQLAVADLERAMSQEGFADAQPHEKVAAYALLGQIAYQGGEYDTALKALDQGIYLAEEFEGHISPHHFRSMLYNRAVVSFVLGYYAPARDDVERYLVLTQDAGYQLTGDDYYLACYFSYMAEDFEKARSYIMYLTPEQIEALASKTQDAAFFLSTPAGAESRKTASTVLPLK